MMKLKKLEALNKVEESTALDRIIGTFMRHGAEIILTQKEKEILERAEHAHSLMQQFNGRRAIVRKELQLKYMVSHSEAFNIIKDAEYIYGQVENVDKNYERYVLLQTIEKGIELCFKTDNMKALKELVKEKRLLLGLDKPDEDEKPNWEEIKKSRTIVIQFSPELLGVEPVNDVDALIRHYKKKLNDVQDIDFEELKNESGNS